MDDSELLIVLRSPDPKVYIMSSFLSINQGGSMSLGFWNIVGSGLGVWGVSFSMRG